MKPSKKRENIYMYNTLRLNHVTKKLNDNSNVIAVNLFSCAQSSE